MKTRANWRRRVDRRAFTCSGGAVGRFVWNQHALWYGDERCDPISVADENDVVACRFPLICGDGSDKMEYNQVLMMEMRPHACEHTHAQSTQLVDKSMTTLMAIKWFFEWMRTAPNNSCTAETCALTGSLGLSKKKCKCQLNRAKI